MPWATIASLATAAATLLLAIATFAAVRASNRVGLATEKSLLAALRPALIPSRPQDPAEEIGFADGHTVSVPGGHGWVEASDHGTYLAIALRNAGPGLAVLQGWSFHPRRLNEHDPPPQPDQCFHLPRDMYVPAGDHGFWHGFFAPDSNPTAPTRGAIDNAHPVTIDLLYSDHEGGQRTISRFVLFPNGHDPWPVGLSRHWNLDRADPRKRGEPPPEAAHD